MLCATDLHQSKIPTMRRISSFLVMMNRGNAVQLLAIPHTSSCCSKNWWNREPQSQSFVYTTRRVSGTALALWFTSQFPVCTLIPQVFPLHWLLLSNIIDCGQIVSTDSPPSDLFSAVLPHLSFCENSVIVTSKTETHVLMSAIYEQTVTDLLLVGVKILMLTVWTVSMGYGTVS